MEDLLPFWTQNYFRHSSYLKIDSPVGQLERME